MKQILIFIALIISVRATRAQTDSIAVDSTTNNYSTLTLGASIVNNADYYGQKSAEKMPYAAIVASYKHKSGLFINALSYRLLNKGSNSFVSAYGAGAGFAFNMSNKWSAELGYNYTWFPQHSAFLQAANPHAMSLSIEHEGWLTTTLEGNYNFGQTNDVFAIISLSKALQVFDLGKNHLIFFTPKADITAGTQKFYSYYLKEKTLRDSIADILDPILGNGGGSTSDTLTRVGSRFDVLSYNLTLPLSYQHGNYLFELSTQLSLLGKQTQSKPGQVNSFFSASFYYQF